MMNVVVSCNGRFHAFYLAHQLLKRGYLERLITSYPKFEVRKYGIPSEKTCSFVVNEVIKRGWRKLPLFIQNFYDPKSFVLNLFDKYALKKIGKSDIFIGWAGSSLLSLRRAKQAGAITIIERGSSHLLYQQRILKEEHERCGLIFNGSASQDIERELKEYEEADYIFIPSSFVKQSFIEEGFPPEKLIQVPYGVDLSEFKKIPKIDKVFRIVTVGGGIRKGTHYLLQAFLELNLPNSELVGLGALSDEMKPFFKKYGSEKIKWIGHKPQKELYKYYSQGSIFIAPSLEEGLAMVQVQAMACGLPLICTINTGGEDLIEDGKEGFVIPIRDVEAIKEKILYFYEHSDRCAEMGRASKEKVQKGFSWDDYGNKIIRNYEELLKVDKDEN